MDMPYAASTSFWLLAVGNRIVKPLQMDRALKTRQQTSG